MTRRRVVLAGSLLALGGVLVAEAIPSLSGAGETDDTIPVLAVPVVSVPTPSTFRMTDTQINTARSAAAADSTLRSYIGAQTISWDPGAIWYNSPSLTPLGVVFRATWPSAVTFPLGFKVVSESTSGTGSVPSQYIVTGVSAALVYVNTTTWSVIGYKPVTPTQTLLLPTGQPAPPVDTVGGE